jgi:hypothetical protein
MENVAEPADSHDLKTIFGFLSVILQTNCGVWREKEQELKT